MQLQSSGGDLKLDCREPKISFLCKTAKTVDARTTDLSQDLRVYWIKNIKKNKRERVTQMLLITTHLSGEDLT